MTKGNHYMTTEFILTGFTDRPEVKILLFVVFFVIYLNRPEVKILLFVVFFVIYLITMVGNLGLVVLTYMECRLHTPMFIFLGNLALMDSCCSCAVMPKMFENFFSEDRMISLYECMAQFYFLCLAGSAACFLLAAMAYDRYVAICSPLQYHTRMSMKLCVQMTTVIYITACLHPIIYVGFLFRLTFYGSHQINHFFCDVFPLYRLSCVDPYINELMIIICTGSIQVFTITVVLISYLCILYSVFKMKSKKGRSKALLTCSSHFSLSQYSMVLFFSCMFNQVQLKKKMKIYLLLFFYTLVIPLLNPFIYNLRNKEVINVMKTIMKKNKSHNILK